MTFNVDLSAIKDKREQILERLKDYTDVLVAENIWFNGTMGFRKICGLGFQTEEERLMFLLEFKDAGCWVKPTDQQFKWGFDPHDFDF